MTIKQLIIVILDGLLVHMLADIITVLTLLFLLYHFTFYHITHLLDLVV